MAQNAKILSDLQLQLGIASLIYIIWRFAVRYSSISIWHIVGFVLVEGSLFFIYTQLQAFSRPSYETGSNVVRDGGADLKSEGMIAYMFDVIYIGLFVLITSAFISDYFWWTFLVIPGYAVYKLWSQSTPVAKGPVKKGRK
ncbi:uncharacterized protein BJ171DRAFT_585040 [Polychytrium aggregatum]|uniref:uncharacterized protein n=1 Tax=Polychytrium aggregatum TaxID=110093 RepID=UPI0022FF03D1|nr:uncharacterized protein BJ171DRAFT_585040 [Polychytrium aggregatum]KAI9199754.1 hypothetical protein BJ171DRAFT_585040 [Polychytrium aggregatum]